MSGQEEAMGAEQRVLLAKMLARIELGCALATLEDIFGSGIFLLVSETELEGSVVAASLPICQPRAYRLTDLLRLVGEGLDIFCFVAEMVAKHFPQTVELCRRLCTHLVEPNGAGRPPHRLLAEASLLDGTRDIDFFNVIVGIDIPETE